jgi:hypothetical protein
MSIFPIGNKAFLAKTAAVAFNPQKQADFTPREEAEIESATNDLTKEIKSIFKFIRDNKVSYKRTSYDAIEEANFLPYLQGITKHLKQPGLDNSDIYRIDQKTSGVQYMLDRLIDLILKDYPHKKITSLRDPYIVARNRLIDAKARWDPIQALVARYRAERGQMPPPYGYDL